MVNANQSGIVSMAGPGFTSRRHGGYQPGEFSRLLNCLITNNGTLKRRWGIKGVGLNSYNGRPKRRFGGIWDSKAVWMGYTNTVLLTEIDSADPLYTFNGPSPSNSLVKDAAGAVTYADPATYADAHDNKLWHPMVLEQFLRYNSASYVTLSGIFGQWNNGTGQWTRRIAAVGVAYIDPAVVVSGKNRSYWDKLDADEQKAQAVLPDNNSWIIKIIDEIDISLDTEDTYSQLPAVGRGNANNVITQFIHKDRLFIVTPTKVLFSKATDPTEFRVSQDGGFVSMADAQINWAVPMGDNIYIFSDNKIDVLSYSTSPNVDGVLTSISKSIGADAAAEYNNEIFFVKHDALYSLTGFRLTKLSDLNLQLERTSQTDPRYTHVWSYLNYLIVANRVTEDVPVDPLTTNVPTNNKNSLYYKGYMNHFIPWVDLTARPDGLGYEIPTTFFIINLDNGSTSELAYHPNQNNLGQNLIADVGVVVREDTSNQQLLYFMCKDDQVALPLYGDDPAVWPTCQYFCFQTPTIQYEAASSLEPYWDHFPTVAEAIAPDYASTYSEVIIRDFAPDGAEYNQKKFRSLEVEAYIESRPLKFTFKYDDSVETAAVDLGPGVTNVPPVGFRLGLNQRSRAMTIRIKDTPDLVGLQSSLWEIYDIRCLWTYTSRGPARRTGSGAS